MERQDRRKTPQALQVRKEGLPTEEKTYRENRYHFETVVEIRQINSV